MSSVPFHYVELRAFCYATEDEERVARAIRTYLPEETELDRESSAGFHGDRIVVLSARVETADAIRYLLDRLGELDSLDRVIEELPERIDEDCSLFIYLDKQAAVTGDVQLGEGISLHAKVEAYPAKQAVALENAREALANL